MRVLLWANCLGISGYLEAVGGGELAGIVVAANRPAELDEARRLAEAAGTPLYVQPFRRDQAAFAHFADRIRSVEADLFVVNAYSMLLEAEWLAWPRRGAINVHAGLLPAYRGANVLNWAIINGENQSGITIHHLDQGIDTGDIILQRSVPIAWEDTALTLREKLLALVGPMLREVLDQAARAALPRFPQDERLARHWPRRRPEDGKIDWRWPAERIYNLIRGLVAPWPGAYYLTADGRRVVIDHWMPLAEVERLQQRMLNAHASTTRCDSPA